MYLLGIDVGDARIGLATASAIARLPSPRGVLQNDSTVIDKIGEIIEADKIDKVIVGLPRNQEGEETSQSLKSREFARKLEEAGFVVAFADESLSSQRAQEAQKNDKSRRPDQPIDDLAACFILEEFLKEDSIG